MVLSDFMLEAFGMLSSESTKKDLLAFVLIYSLISGLLFYFLHDYFRSFLFQMILVSLVLFWLSMISFNIGLRTFYNALFLGAGILNSIEENKLRSAILEYIKGIPTGKSIGEIFNKLISEMKQKGENEKVSIIDRTKTTIVGHLVVYLLFYFLSFVLFFSTLWAVFYDILTSNSLYLFEIKNGNFLILLLIVLFFISVSFCEIKSEGFDLLFNMPSKGKEINEFSGLVSNTFLDSLLWYFTYTPSEEKQKLIERIVNKILGNKIVGKLFKTLFAINLPELISGIKVISRPIFLPLLGKDNESIKPEDRYSNVKSRLEKKFSLKNVIELKPGVENNPLTNSWEELINNIEKASSPVSLSFLVSKGDSNKKIDAGGFFLSFVYNPYVYKITHKGLNQLIEEKALFVYIVLIVREEKYKEYERFLATVF
jgi:ABC-type multidrug transport system fused ATPase/permease subunit